MKNKKIKKALKISLITIIVAFAFVVVGTIAINCYMVFVQGRHILTPEEWKEEDKKDMDCIMVLGCSVREDGTPSNMLQDRLDAAIELYKLSPQKILVSGDHAGPYYNEVRVMKQYLVDAGIPSEEIYMDHYGVSTYESVYRAYHVFDVRRMTIVTQKYHLYRALHLANAIGINADGCIARYDRYEGQFYRDMREVLARDKDFFLSIFWPNSDMPKQTISLKENGDLTNERME